MQVEILDIHDCQFRVTPGRCQPKLTQLKLDEELHRRVGSQDIDHVSPICGRPRPQGLAVGCCSSPAGEPRSTFWSVSPRGTPPKEHARQAVDRLLATIEAGGDIFDAWQEIGILHPKHDTFPGEIFVQLAADALAEGHVSRGDPISEEGVVRTYLPECEFKGRDNHKIRYAVLAGAATYGGVTVDLLDEVVYWPTDAFWSYAALAATAWIRAVAHQRAIPLPELCDRLRARAPA